MNALKSWPRLLGAMILVLAGTTTAVLVSAQPAEAAVVRPFTLNYDQEVYGDYILAGNGSSVCPGVSSPTDPFGEPKATCATAQARTYTAAAGINDSYYMGWADVDSSAATYNSSQASITIPTGARVDFARLNWSGDTGTIRLADGTVSALPGCNTRQFLAGAGTSVLPAGTPESTSVRLTVGGAATAAIAPQVISRDALANVPASQPQFYAAHADVTSRFAGAPTAAPLVINVGNVWTPQGFGCYSGWSLTVVYAYDAPTADAPVKKEVFIYDGHVRQSSVDPTTTLTMTGFNAATAGARVGVTGFEGDFNIAGDQFLLNGTPVTSPETSTTTNFFTSKTDFSSSPAVLNNMSIDARSLIAPIAPGATSSTASFATAGDTYLATGLVLSVPVASIDISTSVTTPGPYLAGDPVSYVITVTSPGLASSNVVVDSPIDDCDRTVGPLPADIPFTYTCEAPAPSDDIVVTNTVTGTSPADAVLTDSSTATIDVIHPAVEITKTVDQPEYIAGQIVTFTITVTNIGDTTLTNLAVTDPTVPGCDSISGTLVPGDDITYPCFAIAPVLGDSNTATVTATHARGTVTDASTVAVPTLGSVSGQVFADRDNDGAVDPGETGISGVTLTLTGTTGSGDPVSLTTTTNTTGDYAFTGVPGGSYTVTETQPAAYDDGIDTAGANATVAGNDAVNVTLASGQSSTDTLFAERPTSSLSGEVYVDADADGVRDEDESGVADVTVTLSGTDDGGNAVSLTAVSDAVTGAYEFSDLRPGTYQVVETQPVGYGNGVAAAGTPGGTAATADSFTEIALPSRTDATGYLFGETMSSLAGAVYSDLDGSGARDAGEPGIDGVTLELTGTDANGAAVSLTTTTLADGAYAFSSLLSGTYTITETQPAGYGDGAQTVGTTGGTLGTNTFSEITLPVGSSGTGYLFGETTGVLSGAVYADLDGNGERGSGDEGIGGVTVTLTGTDTTGEIEPVVTTTASDGSYVFSELLDGTYTITETQPDAYGDGDETLGTADGTASNDVFSEITLAGGASGTDYLFGETTGSIALAVFHDVDGNGARDASEPGLGGVSVTLTGADVDGGAVNVTSVTASDGSYVFSGLLAGDYTVTETQPAGYGDGEETVGTGGGTVGNDSFSAITLTGGASETGYLFGETTGELSGSVYADLDGDGAQGSGDTGIAGVTVTLTGTDTNGAIEPVVTITAADGTYSFTGLLGGSYTITETQPAAYGDASETLGTSGGTVGSDAFSEITLAGGSSGTGYLFGEAIGALSGAVYADLDGDDARGAGDTGIGGVTVTLTGTDANGSVGPLVATTAMDGSYAFPGLLAGSYTITETQPTAYGDGAETLGTVGGTVSGDSFSEIALAGGASGTGYLFGETTGSISGSVFHDADRSGAPEASDPGLEGVTVTLTGTDTLGADVDVTATTAADGSYVFAGLLAGTYTITETQPDGFADGSETLGTAGGTLTGPDSITDIELAGGVAATGYLFGEERGSLSGRVWLDADNDGVEDDDETGVQGVTVTLFDGAADVVTTVVTDADGDYLFADLPAGSYVIGVDPGAGRALTAPGQGDDETGSDVDWLTGLTSEFVVDLEGGENTNQADIDAGVAERADDLGVTLTSEQSSATVGDDVEFTAVVSNDGISPAVGAVLTITLPAGVEAGTAEGEGWTCEASGQTVTCTSADTVLPGDSLPPVTLSGTTTAVGTEAASAVVAFADDTVDVNEENNTSSAPLTIEAVVVPPTDPSEETPVSPAPSLSQTGGEVVPLITIGLMLLAGGVLLLAIRRRRVRPTR